MSPDGDDRMSCGCNCSEGWVGPQCNIPDACDDAKHCSSNGIATGFEGDCSCECDVGWYGAACNLMCTRDSYCKGHGEAVEGADGAGCTCRCDDDWFGTRCTLRAWSMAASIPECGDCSGSAGMLQNHSLRCETRGSLASVCQQASWDCWLQGTLCQEDLQDAAILWQCLPDASGVNCDVHRTPSACTVAGCSWSYQLLDNCSALTKEVCGQNGRVLQVSESCNFECECSVGWRGATCSQIDLCDAAYCNNHGNTSGQVGACSCSCFEGWLGETCDQQCSREDFCGGYGVATFSDAACSCSCDQGRYGPTCAWGCTGAEVCSGHGTALQAATACDCQCDFGWAGAACNISIGAKSEDLQPCSCSVKSANSSQGQLLCEAPPEENQSVAQCLPATWDCWQEHRICQERPPDCSGKHADFDVACRKFATMTECLTQEACEWQLQPAAIWSCFAGPQLSDLRCDHLSTHVECASKLGCRWEYRLVNGGVCGTGQLERCAPGDACEASFNCKCPVSHFGRFCENPTSYWNPECIAADSVQQVCDGIVMANILGVRDEACNEDCKRWHGISRGLEAIFVFTLADIIMDFCSLLLSAVLLMSNHQYNSSCNRPSFPSWAKEVYKSMRNSARTLGSRREESSLPPSDEPPQTQPQGNQLQDQPQGSQEQLQRTLTGQEKIDLTSAMFWLKFKFAVGVLVFAGIFCDFVAKFFNLRTAESIEGDMDTFVEAQCLSKGDSYAALINLRETLKDGPVVVHRTMQTRATEAARADGRPVLVRPD